MSRETLRLLLRNPNAGTTMLALMIALGGGANYSRVDDVADDLAAIKEEQQDLRAEQRDQNRRLAALERE